VLVSLPLPIALQRDAAVVRPGIVVARLDGVAQLPQRAKRPEIPSTKTQERAERARAPTEGHPQRDLAHVPSTGECADEDLRPEIVVVGAQTLFAQDVRSIKLERAGHVCDGKAQTMAKCRIHDATDQPPRH
jgi:hypothetical protein